MYADDVIIYTPAISKDELESYHDIVVFMFDLCLMNAYRCVPYIYVFYFVTEHHPPQPTHLRHP